MNQKIQYFYHTPEYYIKFMISQILNFLKYNYLNINWFHWTRKAAQMYTTQNECNKIFIFQHICISRTYNGKLADENLLMKYGSYMWITRSESHWSEDGWSVNVVCCDCSWQGNSVWFLLSLTTQNITSWLNGTVTHRRNTSSYCEKM